MYLISLYFDANTEKTMQLYIDQVAKTTGNKFMIDGKIPPHITILAFEAKDESMVVKMFEENVSKLKCASIFFAAIGALKGQVIYVEPVQNEYLHSISRELYSIYKGIPDIKFSPYYKPYEWIPHLSVGKHLNEEQMEKAFKVLMRRFAPFEGYITRIGIAKTNPHRDIKVYEI